MIAAANQRRYSVQTNLKTWGLYSRAESTERLEVLAKPKGIDLLVRNSTFLACHPGLGNLASTEILIQLPFCLKGFCPDVLPLSARCIIARTMLSIEMIAVRSYNNCMEKVGLLQGKI